MRKNQNAFTLLEIMMVVAIIGLLLAAAIYKMAPSLDVAKDTKVRADISGYRTSLLTYSAMNGFYPTTEQGLSALVVSPNSDPAPASWRQLMEELQKDPWGSDYVYRCPGQKNPNGYDLFSAGPDRKPDTADDNPSR
jgi:general secretion pathway protein G